VKAIAAGSEPVAEEAANQVLKQSALRAMPSSRVSWRPPERVPGVLLATGADASGRAGGRPFARSTVRCRQPGSGVRRSARIRAGQEVPDAAYAAVPASLGALALLHAHHGELTFERLAEGGWKARVLSAREIARR